jgi:hypothetical protein
MLGVRIVGSRLARDSVATVEPAAEIDIGASR